MHRETKFANIRVSGAFLVSSEIKDGKVQFVRIHSKAGRDCTVENPWSDEEIQIVRNDKAAGASTDKRLVFRTEKDEVIMLRPAGLD